MIKQNKNPATIIMYLLVLLGGFAIFYMLGFEHKQAMSLINKNQLLLKNTVLKTLENNISSQLKKQPISLKDIESNWQNLPLNIRVNYKNKWIFPYRFKGNNDDRPSQLWRHYGLSHDPSKTGLSSLSAESLSRIKILDEIKEALKSNHDEKIKQRTAQYFSLVENYPLSELEEVISSLRFLQLNEETRWNNSLIELLIFKGSDQIKSLTDLLFKQNQQFSKSDIDIAIDMNQSILESANIDAYWFNQSVLALWSDDLNLNAPTLPDFTIIDNQWISIEAITDLKLFLPFSVQSELKLVEDMLKAQGILNAKDTITISPEFHSTPSITSDKLPITIEGPLFRQQIEQQSRFFYIKLLLMLIFLVALIIVVTFIAYRNKKKTELIELRENFVNLVSHELKTPLSSIRVMAETLNKRNQRKLSIKDYPEKITHEVDKLWLMVDNLLSLNQLKSGKLELHLEKINLSGLIDRVHSNFKEHLTSSLTVKNAIPKTFNSSVDSLLIELVFNNLFSNAIKYNTQTETQIVITADIDKQEIYFNDNGYGIEPKNWSKVFEDFYRANNSNQQGTGVGLSLCHQIMQLHGGEIIIESSNECGTTWIIRFPQAPISDVNPTKGVDSDR